ncbi:hypothetical protein Taro_039791 [Colocasia esculenta]|uniref:Acetolactate synthase n=1 Tax=Colocasia esculenta TaxID=4460 RepID=A0A843WWQ0_COLES|nr:hypothetical protein [Colocasia esculenta]
MESMAAGGNLATMSKLSPSSLVAPSHPRFLCPRPGIHSPGALHHRRNLFSMARDPQKPSTLANVLIGDSNKPVAPLATDQVPGRSYGPDEPRKGADILVEALEREGVTDVFAYPGGASMEIHQALTRSPSIANHLFRHEQGEIFAAEGYARSTARPGVCIATSGPGATNLVTGLADALLDSIPLVAITGQVACCMIGTTAFQEIPIMEITRSITKHNYQVLDVDDIPRVVREAFFLATSGRPGPVLVDIPKDIQQQLAVPTWDQTIRLTGYISRLPKHPRRTHLEQIIRLVLESKKPVLCVGGGCMNSSDELRRFVELTGIPVASTLTGLGVCPTPGELPLHGTAYANHAVDKSDLLLAFGVRFDDLVTGTSAEAKTVHIDVEAKEIWKHKPPPHVSICGDVKLALEGVNQLLEETLVHKKLDFSAWREELDHEQKGKLPLGLKTYGDEIPPQYAIQVLDELTNGEAIVATSVGQHQMWAAQWYNYKRPRQWLSSSGLGAKGFGLPAIAGAAVGNPGRVVVAIDGDGSFLMNMQELAVIRVENLPVKMMVLNSTNNQHLGMVVHADLGNPEEEPEIFPDFVTIAEGFDIPGARVTRKGDVREAIRKMLETPGPYLLDVIVPHQELMCCLD